MLCACVHALCVCTFAIQIATGVLSTLTIHTDTMRGALSMVSFCSLHLFNMRWCSDAAAIAYSCCTNLDQLFWGKLATNHWSTFCAIQHHSVAAATAAMYSVDVFCFTLFVFGLGLQDMLSTDLAYYLVRKQVSLSAHQ